MLVITEFTVHSPQNCTCEMLMSSGAVKPKRFSYTSGGSGGTTINVSSTCLQTGSMIVVAVVVVVVVVA